MKKKKELQLCEQGTPWKARMLIQPQRLVDQKSSYTEYFCFASCPDFSIQLEPTVAKQVWFSDTFEHLEKRERSNIQQSVLQSPCQKQTESSKKPVEGKLQILSDNRSSFKIFFFEFPQELSKCPRNSVSVQELHLPAFFYIEPVFNYLWPNVGFCNGGSQHSASS